MSPLFHPDQLFSLTNAEWNDWLTIGSAAKRYYFLLKDDPTLQIVHPSTVLAEVNRHPRDEHIVFIDDGHYYLIHGRRAIASVTGVIAMHHEEFHSLEGLKALGWAKRNGEHKGCYGWQVIDKWTLGGREASFAGSEMHAYLEDYANGKHIPFAPHLQHQLDAFLRFYHLKLVIEWGFELYRTEMVIYADVDRPGWQDICGSVDLICVRTRPADGSKEYLIIDHKNSKLKRLSYNGRKMKGVFSQLYDTNCCHYEVQVNIYAAILREFYDMDIPSKNLYFISYHPELGKIPNTVLPCKHGYYLQQARDLSYEVQQLFAEPREEFERKINASKRSLKREEAVTDFASNVPYMKQNSVAWLALNGRKKGLKLRLPELMVDYVLGLLMGSEFSEEELNLLYDIV